jgi:hypothetical protein
MKVLALATAVACAALAQTSPDAACGPAGARFQVVRDKTQHPLPAPQSGSAVLYVIAANMHTGGTIAIGIDGSWVGAVRDGSYFTLPLSPGAHHLCARVSALVPVMFVPIPLHAVALHSLDAKPGENYYISAQMPPDAGFRFALLDPDEARHLLQSAKFSTSKRR